MSDLTCSQTKYRNSQSNVTSLCVTFSAWELSELLPLPPRCRRAARPFLSPCRTSAVPVRLLFVRERQNPTERLIRGRGGGSVFQWLGHNFSLLMFQLVSHIEEMLQTAYNKFHTWQSRRMLKKT